MTNQPDLDARILDDVADALIYSDRSGNILRWNRASTTLFGFTAEDALGQNLDLIIPEHLPHWKGFEAALASGNMKLAGKPTLDPRAAQKRDKTLHRNDVCTGARCRRPCAGIGGDGARRHRARRARTRGKRSLCAENFVKRNCPAAVQGALHARQVACHWRQ